jgi:hypothetical protein
VHVLLDQVAGVRIDAGPIRRINQFVACSASAIHRATGVDVFLTVVGVAIGVALRRPLDIRRAGSLAVDCAGCGLWDLLQEVRAPMLKSTNTKPAVAATLVFLWVSVFKSHRHPVLGSQSPWCPSREILEEAKRSKTRDQTNHYKSVLGGFSCRIIAGNSGAVPTEAVSFARTCRPDSESPFMKA